METKLAIRKIYAGEEGFTLIEIAIVMVIVGLLLGGVLKGQEMIENGRARNAISSLDGVSAAYNSYFDRYRRIPGDDGPDLATLTARGGNWANITQFGNNNGVLLTAAANTFNGGDENDNFWQHLRAAGFITGNPALAGAAALPINAFSGLTGITNAAVMADAAGAALNGNKVCLAGCRARLLRPSTLNWMTGCRTPAQCGQPSELPVRIRRRSRAPLSPRHTMRTMSIRSVGPFSISCSGQVFL